MKDTNKRTKKLLKFSSGEVFTVTPEANMKNATLFFLATLLFLTGCHASDNAINTAIAKTLAAQPTLTPTFEPTLTPTPSPTVTSTPTITLTPTPEFLQYYTENFDVDNQSWSYFIVDGRTSSMTDKTGVNFTPTMQDGFLYFDFLKTHTYAYAYYNRFTYDDVRIDAKVANLGVNENFLTIICRYDPKVGWYEFNFNSAGLYMIYAAHIAKNDKAGYDLLADGGANNIKQGKDENEFSLVCQGKTITAYINGKELKQITDNRFVFTSGYSGISTSSAYRLPIKARFDWVKFSSP